MSRPNYIQIRCTDHEIDTYNRLAARDGVSLAEWVRTRLSIAAAESLPVITATTGADTGMDIVRGATLAYERAQVRRIMRRLKRGIEDSMQNVKGDEDK